MSDKSIGKEGVCEAEESINWKQCIFCQSDNKKGVLVQHPKLESYGLILHVVQERASLQKAVWHRSCHSRATNKVKIQRARNRNAHALPTGHYTAKKRGQKRVSTETVVPDPSTSGSSLPFTRSHTSPLDKEECFFCQKDNGQPLYQIRTENAGKELKDAMERSHNTAMKTRLNTCISAGDAHAIDVKYHKPC